MSAPNEDVQTIAQDQRQFQSNLCIAAQQPPASAATKGEDPQEFTMDPIVSHWSNKETEHPSARLGETTYRIRCYGCNRKDSTFEPIWHEPIFDTTMSFEQRAVNDSLSKNIFLSEKDI